jgi:hypothetical protein
MKVAITRVLPGQSARRFQLKVNAARLEQLQAKLAATEKPDSRSEATKALRGLADAILLTPDQASETLPFELRIW